MKEHICKAKRVDNGKWIEGYYMNYKAFSSDNAENHTILPVCENGLLASRAIAILPETVCRCTGMNYMDGEIAYQGDIYENPGCGVVFVLKYGTYTAYCPADNDYMDSVGFYAEAVGYPQMPIGDLSTYALKIGNIFDNLELLETDLKENKRVKGL